MTPLPSYAFLDPLSGRQVIRNQTFEAMFQPLAGGRMMYLRHADHGDILVPLRDASFSPSNWPKAGAFPLFPFHNRLRNAAFNYGGHVVQLKPNAANGTDTMHGPAHRRPWQVTGKGSSFITMNLAYQPDDEWPFHFTATQHFELHEDQLTITLKLTNTDDATMPAGLGWHPYFQPSRDGKVITNATTRWEQNDTTKCPEEFERSSSTDDSLLKLDSTVHYANWTNASARIGDGAAISLSADKALSHLVLHRKNEYLCIEPTSHAAGAFATLPEPPTETGIRMLAPGETMTGTAALQVNHPKPAS